METLGRPVIAIGDTVRVVNPGTAELPGWETAGKALATAPFSVLLSYRIPATAEPREDWFRILTAIRHGDTNEDATRYLAA